MPEVTTEELRKKYVNDDFDALINYLVEKGATDRVNLQLELQQIREERDALRAELDAIRAETEAQKSPTAPEEPPAEES